MNVVLTRDQIREVDRLAIERVGVPGVVLMENAGRNTAHIILERIGHDTSKIVNIVCGRGNNGGDGFVIARHLHICGVTTGIYLCADPDALTGDAAVMFNIVRQMPIHIFPVADDDGIGRHCAAWKKEDIFVDALLGTGFSGQVRQPMATLIDRINDLQCSHVFAVDVPSGLDCDTGQPAASTVRADCTVTFVAAKKGLTEPGADQYTGEVVVANIGCPLELIDEVLAASRAGG